MAAARELEPPPAGDEARPQRHALTRRAWVVAGALLLGGVFRFHLVREYHVPAGDGHQYWALSQELLRAGRFAFGPPPALPTFSRLPGYPLFLAYVAVRRFPADLETHLVRATRANAILDLATALLVFLILRERRFPWSTALGALAAVVVAPLLLMLASYGLTETLATFLATLELYLALRASRTRSMAEAALAGVAAGCAQLVRVDALTMMPAVLLALMWGGGRRRILVSAFLAAAAVVFAPWPLRNVVLFGRPYPAAWQWRTLFDGRPLPTGPIAWARTWATGAHGEGYLDVLFAVERPLPVDNREVLREAMYDSAWERAQVMNVFLRYDREGLSAGVDEDFRALAADRARRAPVRTFVILPLRRLLRMYAPVPADEIPMESRLLGLPRLRPLVLYWDLAVYALAAGGLAALLRREAGAEERRTAMVFACALGMRSLVEPVLVPLSLTQRMLAEVYPVLLMLAACGASAAITGTLRAALSVPPNRKGRTVAVPPLGSSGSLKKHDHPEQRGAMKQLGPERDGVAPQRAPRPRRRVAPPGALGRDPVRSARTAGWKTV